MTITKRGAAAIAGSAMFAAALPLLSLAPADAAVPTATIDKAFTYGCQTDAGGLSLGVKQVGVRATFDAPSQLYPGQFVEPTPAKITLTLPEDLRSATKGLLGANYVDGSSSDAALAVGNVNADGVNSVRNYLISGLVAARQAVPDASPWNVVVNGTSPRIPVYLTSTSVILAMPKTFNIKSTVYKNQNDTSGTPVSLACTISGSSALTKPALKVVKLNPTLTANIVPSPLTTSSTPYVQVVASSDRTPRGTVNVLSDGVKIGTGELNGSGKVNVVLPKFTTKGTKTLTIQYAGNEINAPASITKTVTVS